MSENQPKIAFEIVQTICGRSKEGKFLVYNNSYLSDSLLLPNNAMVVKYRHGGVL